MSEMIDEVMQELQQGVEGAVAALKTTLSQLRTGRANLAILDGVRVSYYGTPTPLSQCANLVVSDPRLIIVKPWDKSLAPDIEKAIMAADIGITPQSDGDVIRLPVPALNEERRKELVKQAKQRGEDTRIAIRNHRRDANEMLKDLEKEKQISQDDLKRTLERVQADVDSGVAKVEQVISAKEKDILEV